MGIRDDIARSATRGLLPRVTGAPSGLPPLPPAPPSAVIVPSTPPVSGIGSNRGPTLADYSSVNAPPHTADPRYSGAAPNRTTPYPRYRPAKTTPRFDRLQSQIDDPESPIQGLFDRYIERGTALGGPDWYNTEELRDWFRSGLGDVEGDRQWREYMELIGTTSTGAKVPGNIRVASFYRALSPEDRQRVTAYMAKNRATPHGAAKALGIDVPDLPDNPAYGHLKQKNQALNVANREAGSWDRDVPEGLTGAALSSWLKANPKVKGFGNDLLGDDTNIAADMHFMRMLAMADGGMDFLSDKAGLSAENMQILRDAYGPRRIQRYVTTRTVDGKPVSTVNLRRAAAEGVITDTGPLSSMPTAWADTPKANEYAAYEDMAGRVAERYGMTPAQFQASLWMGAGDITGLADESQGTFMELFRRALDNRALQRGVSREDMLRDFIENRAPLSVPLLGGAAVGGGLLAPQDQERSPRRGLLDGF